MSYLPNDLSTDTVVSLTRVQQNDAALDTAISGNLTQANLSSSTQIPNSMLANSSVEEIITLRWGAPAGTAIPAASTSIPMDMVHIPGTATYTIQNASYAVTCPTGGGVTGAIRLDAGAISAAVFASSTNLVAATSLTNVASNNQSATGSFTLANSTFTAPITLAMLPTTTSTTATPRVTVTLRVTRALQ